MTNILVMMSSCRNQGRPRYIHFVNGFKPISRYANLNVTGRDMDIELAMIKLEMLWYSGASFTAMNNEFLIIICRKETLIESYVRGLQTTELS